MRQPGSIANAAARRARRTAVKGLRTAAALRARTAERGVLAAAAIDADWVAAQLGVTTGGLSPHDAARRYLVEGARYELSPLLTFEPTWYAPDGRGLGADPLARYMKDGPGLHGAHPLVVEEPTSKRQVAVSLGRTLDASLPVPDGWPSTTVADLRARLTPLAAVLELERTRVAGHIAHAWDDAADQAYVAGLRDHAPVPDGSGPMVSIVLPVRNRPEQVATAVASVQAQDYAFWELLVIDDGSTDNTPDVVEALAETDSRIRVLRYVHAGVCAARNAGIEAAQGKFVAFLDSDNTWRPHFLRTMVAGMSAQDLSAAYAVMHETGASRPRYRVGKADADALVLGNVVDLNVLVVRTELLREVGGFDPTLRRMVDYDLAWRLARRTTVTLLPFVGADYDNDPRATDRISTTEAFAWGEVVRTRNTVDLAAAATEPRDESVLSVVIPARSYAATTATVTALLSGVGISGVGLSGGTPRIEVVVVDSGTSPGTARLLHGALPSWPGVRVIRLPRDLHRAGSFDAGLVATTGATVVFLDEGIALPPAGLAALVAPLEDPSVALTRSAAHPARVAAARAADWLAIGGLYPLLVLDYEVRDAADRLAHRGGKVLDVTLVGTTARFPARLPDEATARDNQLAYELLVAERWSSSQ